MEQKVFDEHHKHCDRHQIGKECYLCSALPKYVNWLSCKIKLIFEYNVSFIAINILSLIFTCNNKMISNLDNILLCLNNWIYLYHLQSIWRKINNTLIFQSYAAHSMPDTCIKKMSVNYLYIFVLLFHYLSLLLE